MVPSVVLDVLISVSSGSIGAFLSYEFIDKRRKRLLDTYWRIEEEYRSETQMKAQQCLQRIHNEYKSDVSTKADEGFMKPLVVEESIT